MANYSQLKQSVKNLIKENGQQEITGDIMQSVLLTIIESLGTRAQFAGVATPATNPGSPDGNVFYFAVRQGTYSNFAAIEIEAGDGLTLLVYDGTWKKVPLGTAMQSDMETLTEDITDLKGHIRYEYSLQKMTALTDSSSSTDIQQALTPTYAPDGSTAVRKPVSGDFLVTGNNTSIVYGSTTTKFSFIHGGNKVSITVSANNSSVSVKKTPVDTRVYDLDKINALDEDSTPEEIQSAIGGNTPSSGDLLQGSSDSTWVIESTTQRQNTESFSYPLKGKLRTVTVTGSQGSQSVTVREEDLVPVRYSYEKINALTDDSTDSEIDEAVTPLDGAAARLPLAGDYLVDANGNPAGIVRAASPAPSFVYTVYPFDMTAVSVHGQRGEYTVTVAKLSITEDILQPLSNLGTPQDTPNKNTAFGRIAKLRKDVGEATDEAAADGSLYARQKQNAEDIAKTLSIQQIATFCHATYDEETGLFSLNGLTDITQDQLLRIFIYGWPLKYVDDWTGRFGAIEYFRTNPRFAVYQVTQTDSYQMYGAFQGNSELEVLDFTPYYFNFDQYRIKALTINNIGLECRHLRKISPINVTAVSQNISDIGEKALEEVYLFGLKVSANFERNPKLKKECILYMIQNSAATSAITITLHPTAYAMAIADNDIQTALQNKTFVSLAQAETTE